MKLKLCNNGLSVAGINEDGMHISYSIEADEYKQWLSEGNIPEPEFTEEELTARELNEKISTANQYLAQTDWVNAYKIRHDFGLDMIPEYSSKWEVVNKREEYIEFLKGVK